jgi:hypothetical protein
MFRLLDASSYLIRGYDCAQMPGHVDAGPIIQGFGPSGIPWSTAEEEKARLYEQAQAAARRTQGMVSYSPPPTATELPTMSTGAALYQQAMSAVNQPSLRGQIPESRTLIPQYPSGESEKTAYQRYYEAKAAASRNQGQRYSSSEPISYDALYPVDHLGASQAHHTPSVSPPPPPVNGDSDLPPAFGTPSHPYSLLSEKERLRRHYETQDATMAPAPASPPPHSSPMPAPPSFTPPPGVAGFMTNGLSEKEILRRKFEADDAAALAAQSPMARPPVPPPRSLSISSGHGLPPIPRSPPALPVFDGPSMPLSASEEKARLKAQYDAEDARANGDRSPSLNSNHSLPTPPPLRPRPPVQYIRETQEEDSRTQSQLMDLDKRHSPDGQFTGFRYPKQSSPNPDETRPGP